MYSRGARHGADGAAHRQHGDEQSGRQTDAAAPKWDHVPSIPRPRSLRRHSLTRRRRSALAITETELTLIAAAAIIGLSSTPKSGYSTPAAIGTPAAL